MKTTIISTIFLMLLGFSTNTIFAQTCTPTPSGLVSWYRAEGNTLDFTGINNGTPNGAVTYAAGEVAQAFQFNGSSSVEVPDSASLDFTNAITIEGWVNPTGNPAFGTIVNKGRLDTFGGQPYSVLTINQNGTPALNFRLGNSSTFDSIVSGAIPLNSYTHFAATYDGTTMKIYLNGTLSATKTTTIGTLANENLGLHIGSSTGFSFIGAIDELSLYNRALSLSEIQAIVAADSAGKCRPPITSVVNTTSDTNDGVCDTTHCSLREAIIASNNNFTASMPDRIEFNIPGGGTQTIMPTSALPTITDPVVIDGYTQPGATANTNLTGAINAVLKIELNGASAAGVVNGLSISAGGSTVRGLVINGFSSNSAYGIVLYTNGGNLIEGNFIGSNASGSAAQANSNGLGVSSSNNTIGGTSAAARNIISGNNISGIQIDGDNNFVQGNLIGTNATGTVALGNLRFGIYIGTGTNNTIGGTTTVARNIISGNDTGILFYGEYNPSGNVVQGNFIGTDVSGTANLGNVQQGIYFLLASANNSNAIGGTAAGAGNKIAFNGQEGVLIDGLSNSAISVLSNSIFSNTNLGIDLAPGGVTPNDTGDADTGVNNLQNYPVLSSSSTSGGSTTISGTFNSTAGMQFRIEFFSNAACDSSGFGEGETFIGFQNAMTDGSGNATVSFTPSSAVAVGRFITSTATDPAGNTSEFSGCVQNLAPTAAAVSVSGHVATAFGRGIGKARVYLTDSQGNTRIAQTNPFGYYRFANVQVGETYILSVSAKRYRFENPTQVLNLNDELENVNFTASSEAIKLPLQ